jgi:hypothetical protein
MLRDTRGHLTSASWPRPWWRCPVSDCLTTLIPAIVVTFDDATALRPDPIDAEDAHVVTSTAPTRTAEGQPRVSEGRQTPGVRRSGVSMRHYTRTADSGFRVNRRCVVRNANSAAATVGKRRRGRPREVRHALTR